MRPGKCVWHTAAGFHESPVTHHQSRITGRGLRNTGRALAPQTPKAPAIPFPRNVRRFWVLPYASCLPSRVPPILAAVSLSRMGR
jgi:hypothetical protein